MAEPDDEEDMDNRIEAVLFEIENAAQPEEPAAEVRSRPWKQIVAVFVVVLLAGCLIFKMATNSGKSAPPASSNFRGRPERRVRGQFREFDGKVDEDEGDQEEGEDDQRPSDQEEGKFEGNSVVQFERKVDEDEGDQDDGDECHFERPLLKGDSFATQRIPYFRVVDREVQHQMEITMADKRDFAEYFADAMMQKMEGTQCTSGQCSFLCDAHQVCKSSRGDLQPWTAMLCQLTPTCICGWIGGDPTTRLNGVIEASSFDSAKRVVDDITLRSSYWYLANM